MLVAALGLIAFAACYGGGERYAPPEETAPPLASTTGSAQSAGAATDGVLPIRLPTGWQEEPPSSGMRLAQATIPGEAGDGQFALFYFGPGGGGGVEDNLARWIDQVDADAGTEPQQGAFPEGPYRVTWVEVRGTLKPSTIGMGPTAPEPGSMLLGAVVEGPGGPWFLKATGPRATLEAERDAFFAMLEGLSG
jgi:hypothetical protein